MDKKSDRYLMYNISSYDAQNKPNFYTLFCKNDTYFTSVFICKNLNYLKSHRKSGGWLNLRYLFIGCINNVEIQVSAFVHANVNERILWQ